MQQESDLPVSRTETTVELTYLMQIGKHWALQPDFQFVMRPGTDPARRNALAVLLRFELSY
jgi:porin